MPAPTPLNVLALRAQGGCQVAAEAVLERLAAKIDVLAALWQRATREELDDLRQIARIEILHAIKTYDAERGNFGTYSDKCISYRFNTLRKAITRVKRGSGIPPLSLATPVGWDGDHDEPLLLGDVLADASPVDVEGVAIGNLTWTAAQQTLTDQEIELANLLIAGHTLVEAAARLSLTRAAARKLLTAVQAKLRSTYLPD